MHLCLLQVSASAGGVTMADLAVLLLVLLVVIAAPYVLWKLRAQRPAPPQLRDIRETAVDRTAARGQADQMMVDLLETHRELQAQLDTKIRVFNKLVKDADRQAGRLEALLAQAEDTEPPSVARSGPTPRPDNNATSAPPPAADAPTPGTPADRRPSGRFWSDLHERVAHLRRQGKSTSDIASALRLSQREVELFVHLLAEAGHE